MEKFDDVGYLVCRKMPPPILSLCTEPRLIGTYEVTKYYDPEEIKEIAESQLKGAISGFKAKTFFHDKKVYIHFDKMVDCKFFLDWHRYIDIIPGEIEWNLKLKLPKEHVKIDEYTGYIVVVENVKPKMKSKDLLFNLWSFGPIYSMKRIDGKAFVKFSNEESAQKAIASAKMDEMTFRNYK